MLATFLTDEEDTWIGRNAVLHKDAENTVDGACKQWGSFKKTGNRRILGIKKRTVEIF